MRVNVPVDSLVGRLGRLFAVPACLLTAGAVLQASDYFVSPQGSETNSGLSQGQAWKSIAKVNQGRFRSGDRILFQAGQTFAGNLAITPANLLAKGGRPLEIGTYGLGSPATISAGSGTGLSVYNTANLTISNLRFIGNPVTNQGSGLAFTADLPGNVKLEHINITNVEVAGFGQYGILLQSNNGLTGYRDVLIEDVSTHDNTEAGLYVMGPWPRPLSGYPHSNVTVRRCRAFNNSGRPGTETNSGNGIVLSTVDNGLIERSIAYGNGWRNTANGGPVGIWAWDSNHVTIQYNESHSNRTASATDGGGFDLDGGSINSVLQYNYSHDNDGAGYLLAEFDGVIACSHNTIRFNISQNDGRRNGYSGIVLWNGGAGIDNIDIFNNTIFMSLSTGATPKGLEIMTPTTNVHIRNNLFVTTGGVPLISVTGGQQGLLVQGNNYWASGSTTAFAWAGQWFDSLSSWRTATGQEKIGAVPLGTSVDPRLANAGQGPSLDDASRLASGLPAYQLQAGSPLLGRGLDLRKGFGVDPGDNDFFANRLNGNPALSVGAYSPASRK